MIWIKLTSPFPIRGNNTKIINKDNTTSTITKSNIIFPVIVNRDFLFIINIETKK